MKVTVDSAGRIMLPKSIRVALGIVPGSELDISLCGDGLHLAVRGRTARIEELPDGSLVACSDTPITDDDMFSIMDSMRR